MRDRTSSAAPEVVAEKGARAVGRRVAVGSLRLLLICRAALKRLFDQRDAWNRLLVIGLGLVAGTAYLLGLPELIGVFPAGIDFEIPMRAAAHWSSGAAVYPPSAMFVQTGPDLPYLYPPFLLPLLAPVAALPRPTVTGLWLILCILCAIWTCRRLAIPWLAVPFVLAWPPFAEGLITGNSQILAFAAFVAFLYEPIGAELRPKELRPARDALNGVLAAAVGALKATQLLPILYLARRRFRAAAIGVMALGAVAAAMLPWTGISIYGDWLAQLERAADPSWTIGGVAVGRLLHIPDLALAAAGIAIALAARGRDAGVWLGIALLIATPSVHGYTFLFLLPGLLTIRRDYAIVLSTLFLGVYHGVAWWVAFVIVVYLLVASARWTWLRRPDDGIAEGAAGGPEPAALEVAPA